MIPSSSHQNLVEIRTFLLTFLLSGTIYFNDAISWHFIATAFPVLSAHFRREISQSLGRDIGAAEMVTVWSWIIALHPLGAVIGAILVPMMSKKVSCLQAVGYTVIFVGLPANILKALSYFPRCWPMYIVGSLLGGILQGVTKCSLSVYITEVSSKRIRGALGNTPSCTGRLIYILAAFLGDSSALGTPTLWPWAFVLSGVMAMFFILLFCYLPLSPVYLASLGRYKEASEALRFYRGLENPEDLKKQLHNVIKDAAASAQEEEEEDINNDYQPHLMPRGLDKDHHDSVWVTISKLRVQILIALSVGLGFTAYAVITPLSSAVFQRAGFSVDTANRLSVGLRIMSALVAIGMTPVLQMTKNRPRYLLGTFSVATALVACGILTEFMPPTGRRYTLMPQKTLLQIPMTPAENRSFIMSSDRLMIPDDLIPNSLPHPVMPACFVILIFFQMFASDAGIRAMFFFLIPEIFPHPYRSFGKAIEYTTYQTVGFIGVLIFLPILQSSCPLLAFGLLAVPTGLSFIYCYRNLPETHKKELHEIQQLLPTKCTT